MLLETWKTLSNEKRREWLSNINTEHKWRILFRLIFEIEGYAVEFCEINKSIDCSMCQFGWEKCAIPDYSQWKDAGRILELLLKAHKNALSFWRNYYDITNHSDSIWETSNENCCIVIIESFLLGID